MHPPAPTNGDADERRTELALPGQLPSGRRVVARADERGELIEVRSPAGDVELRIVLTADGPVVQLRGARLELDSNDTVSLNCRRLELRATDGIVLESGGNLEAYSAAEVHVKSAGDAYIDGKLVNLNCKDRTGYPDAEATAAVELPAPAQEPAHDCGCHGHEGEAG